MANLVAHQDEVWKAHRARELDRRRRTRIKQNDIEQLLNELGQVVDAIANSTTQEESGMRVMNGTETVEHRHPSNKKPIDCSTLKGLALYARRGDKNAIAKLKEVLDQNPKLWQELGDLAAMTRSVVIDSLADHDPLLHGSVLRKANQLEQELVGESPSLITCLAVRRFVAVWLRLQYADAASAVANKAPMPISKYWAERQNQASKQYDKALKTLMKTLKDDSRRQSPEGDTLDPKEIILRVCG